MVFLCASLACVLVVLIDGWFLRPQRDPGATSVDEPMLPKLAGYALMALALGMLWRLFRYEAVDFSLMLVAVGALSGAIWGLDRLLFANRRRAAAAAAGTPAERIREPVAVEYARSFFPVIVLVLVIRSFLFEPFRIPSDSMMPTLYDGDFIFVSRARGDWRECAREAADLRAGAGSAWGDGSSNSGRSSPEERRSGRRRRTWRKIR